MVGNEWEGVGITVANLIEIETTQILIVFLLF